jgi:stage II sporulation protein E
MKEDVKKYALEYSLGRIEETAKTFRRLGETYYETTGISGQLLLVADVLEECVKVNLYSEDVDRDKARELIRRCLMAGVRIKNITVIIGENGVTQLALSARTIGKTCVGTRKITAVIKEVFGQDYYIPGSTETLVTEDFRHYLFIKEARFKMLSGVARRGKGTSHFNGDNFLISRLECGKTTAAIADGMGSGKKAFAESRMVIELMENCIEAGFKEKAALDLVNAAYISGSGKGLNPVTMDMSVIDCDAGMLSCIKMGAAATFIKRENMCEIIKSTTLPIGVLENVDFDCVTKKLYDGDYVVMISDGILDNLPGVKKEEKMASLINEIKVKKPAAMAEEIMRKSLSHNGGKPSDDMTVLVLGLFDTYEK